MFVIAGTAPKGVHEIDKIMTTLKHFRSEDFSGIVNIFFKPVQTLLGPNKSLKFIVDRSEGDGSASDVVLTSSSLVFIGSVCSHHPSCRLLMDACLMMEQHVGCGYTYMLSFASSLLETLDTLITEKMLLFEINHVVEMVRKDCSNILERLRISIQNLSDVNILADRDGDEENLECKPIVEKLLNRDRYSSGHNVSFLKGIVTKALDMLRLAPARGKPEITMRGVKRLLQVIALGGKHVENSFISHGVMVPMSPASCFHWMTEHAASFTNKTLHRVAIMKGDDIFCVAREGICSRSNCSMQNIAVDLGKNSMHYACIVDGWNRERQMKYTKISTHLKVLNVTLLFVCGNISSEDEKLFLRLKQSGIISLCNLTSTDVEKLSMLLGVPISTSIMQLSEENVGSNSMNVQKIDSGWMDGCDAIYSSGKSKTNSLNTRENVSFLFFSLTEDKKKFYDRSKPVPICVILFHSIYSMSKDMENLFWNMFFRVYKTLESGYVLPGHGYTEVCLYYLLEHKSKDFQRIYQHQIANTVSKSSAHSLLVNSLVYKKVAEVFKSLHFKVRENAGETFERSSLAFQEKLQEVDQTLHEVLANRHENGINFDRTMQWNLCHFLTNMQEGYEKYDCYSSKLDGLCKGFDATMLIMGCDTIVLNG